MDVWCFICLFQGLSLQQVTSTGGVQLRLCWDGWICVEINSMHRSRLISWTGKMVDGVPYNVCLLPPSEVVTLRQIKIWILLLSLLLFGDLSANQTSSHVFLVTHHHSPSVNPDKYTAISSTSPCMWTWSLAVHSHHKYRYQLYHSCCPASQICSSSLDLCLSWKTPTNTIVDQCYITHIQPVTTLRLQIIIFSLVKL